MPTTAQGRNAQPPNAAQAGSSQPPAPGGGNQQGGPQQQAEPESANTNGKSQQGTGNVIVTIEAPRAEQQSQRRSNAPEDQKNGTPNNWWTAVSAVGTVAQAIFAFVLISLTGALIWVGWKQRETSEKQGRILDATLAAQKIIERGYVDISHGTADDWTLQPNVQTTVRIVIKNHGRTPADIVNFIVRFRIVHGALPELPTYDDAGPEAHVVLMPGESINFPLQRTFSADEIAAINGGDGLYLIGYIDYRDRFGERHRGGYARRYNVGPPVTFSFVTQPGYNYDRDLD